MTIEVPNEAVEQARRTWLEYDGTDPDDAMRAAIDAALDTLTDVITEALVAARKAGKQAGVLALRDLRARLELVEPVTVTGSALLRTAFDQGHNHGVQACRAEAATVLANLTRSTHEEI